MPAGKCLVSIRFKASAERLPEIRQAVRRAAVMEDCAPELVDGIVLAVNEACMNIIQHAYGAAGAGDILLEIFRSPQELTVRLTDFAGPIDPAACKPRRLDDVRPGGLGTHFMKTLMDEVCYLKPPSGQGNILQMKKKLKSSAPPPGGRTP